MLISKFDNTNIGEFIMAFEKENNITLPEEYKRFLMKYNGGETPKTKFKLNKVNSDIKAFYGLGNADKIYNFIAPKIIGDNSALSSFNYRSVKNINDAKEFVINQVEMFSPDVLLTLYKK